MAITLDAEDPRRPDRARSGTNYKFDTKLVNPANKRKLRDHRRRHRPGRRVGGRHAGRAGYKVHAFTFHDSPRRAHSIAAQGGINAAKNYRGDGDSIYRLFYDTVKGGDFRSREANVYRLAEVSVDIIDQCVAQGVPFAREYGGLLDNRSFGGAQVSRTFYARGQTGQQLLLGAYQQLARQVGLGNVTLYNRIGDARRRRRRRRCAGIVVRDLLTGEIESHSAHAVVLATGGYGNVFYLSTNAMACNVTAAWRAHRRGALFANPCYTQIHPTCIPQSDEFQSKLTLMSESLRNDGRIWVPRTPTTTRRPTRSRRAIATTTSSAAIRASATWRRATSRRGPPSGQVDAGQRRRPAEERRVPRLRRRHRAPRRRRRSRSATGTSSRCTSASPTRTRTSMPMRIYPAPHYTMGGLWVDYELMTTIPGLYCTGEANFSDHGANRLGASALMQGLADGYFVLPVHDQQLPRPAARQPSPVPTDHPAFKAAEQEARDRFDAATSSIGGTRSPD